MYTLFQNNFYSNTLTCMIYVLFRISAALCISYSVYQKNESFHRSLFVNFSSLLTIFSLKIDSLETFTMQSYLNQMYTQILAF